jgi:hypothetical protein
VYVYRYERQNIRNKLKNYHIRKVSVGTPPKNGDSTPENGDSTPEIGGLVTSFWLWTPNFGFHILLEILTCTFCIFEILICTFAFVVGMSFDK